MALNIKNNDTQRLSRELAELTGESITTAVTVAVQERLRRLRGQQLSEGERATRLVELGAEIAGSFSDDALKVEDLYDNAGLPA